MDMNELVSEASQWREEWNHRDPDDSTLRSIATLSGVPKELLAEAFSGLLAGALTRGPSAIVEAVLFGMFLSERTAKQAAQVHELERMVADPIQAT